MARTSNTKPKPMTSQPSTARSRFEQPGVQGVDIWALPRGQHKRQPGEIAASQQARIFYALVQSVAEKGYVATTLNDLCQLAKVSKTTFYSLFKDKQDCYIAAYTAAHHELAAAMARGQDASSSAQRRSHDAIAAYLQFNRDNPAVARCFLVEIHAVGPSAWHQHAWGHERMAHKTQALYQLRRAEQPGLPQLPPEIFLALVTAIEEMVSSYVRSGWTARVMELLPRAMFLLEAVYTAKPETLNLLQGSIPSA